MPTWWAVDDPQTRLSPWFSSTWPTTSDRQHHYRHESLWWASPGGLRWLFVQIIRRTKPLLAPTFTFLCWYKMERFARLCVEKRFHSFMIVKPKTCDLLCFSLVWAISPLSSHSDGVPYRGHVYATRTTWTQMTAIMTFETPSLVAKDDPTNGNMKVLFIFFNEEPVLAFYAGVAI